MMKTIYSRTSIAVIAGLALAVSTPTGAQPAAKSEAENLVPPGGAAFDIPLHAGEVCILSFPGEKLVDSTALISSADFEVQRWGTDGVAVRATGKKATSTLALATTSGAIKINVTLHIVPATQQALTLVRFKAASAEDAFQARVTAEVAKQMEPVKAELAKTKQSVDALLRDRADHILAERLLKRTELEPLNAHERNDDNVIVHVERAAMIGDDAYLYFEIENRSTAAFRVARATVTARDKPVNGPARLFSSTLDKDPTVLGIVTAGTTARGIVVVRSADQVRGTSLALEIADLNGRGTIRLDRGIVLR